MSQEQIDVVAMEMVQYAGLSISSIDQAEDKALADDMSSLQQFTSPTKRKGVNVGLREMSAWLLLCKEHLVERGFLSSSLHPKNTFTSSPSYEPSFKNQRIR